MFYAGYTFGSFRGYIDPPGYALKDKPAFDISGFRLEPIGVTFYF